MLYLYSNTIPVICISIIAQYKPSIRKKKKMFAVLALWLLPSMDKEGILMPSP
jgi:hypothetical protein